MPQAGLIYGPEFHHLDHLAPLCALLSIPLLVTEEKMACLAQKFYPDLQVIHWSEHTIPEKLVTHFDTIFYSTPRVLFDLVFFFAQKLLKKKLRTIWCPHGNSDKGRTTPFMEALQEEETLLIYGKRMETFLREKNVAVQTICIGNYRLAYYQKHKHFYDELITNTLGNSAKTTLLYAPTWQDLENNSSFLTACPILLQNLPKEYQLIIKLHPNLHLQFPNEVEALKSQGNFHFLEDFPPIYPLLDRTDLYIGDMSSISYDFLAFKRPMLFLNENQLPPSHPNWQIAKAGRLLCPKDYKNLYSHCAKLLKSSNLKKAQQALYEMTFTQDASFKEILRIN